MTMNFTQVCILIDWQVSVRVDLGNLELPYSQCFRKTCPYDGSWLLALL
jgi:hypothetical protein